MPQGSANGGPEEEKRRREQLLRRRAETVEARRAQVPLRLSDDPAIRARQMATIDELVFFKE